MQVVSSNLSNSTVYGLLDKLYGTDLEIAD
jgi:hypothetical protein